MKTLVSYRELNNNRKSHVDENDKLNMSLLKELFHTPNSNFAHQCTFLYSLLLGKSGLGMLFHWLSKNSRAQHLSNASAMSQYPRSIVRWETFTRTATVEYLPISTTDQAGLHQYGKKVLPGLFMGHAVHARGSWEGDLLVADDVDIATFLRFGQGTLHSSSSWSSHKNEGSGRETMELLLHIAPYLLLKNRILVGTDKFTSTRAKDVT